MSILLLALMSCAPDAPVRRFQVTATYGSFDLVAMDGTGAGTLHGYFVDGQFGLPTLAVNLGDTIEITLYNETGEDMGLHGHGLRYDEDNNGVSRVAAPGESVTYTWYATEGVGNFLYHSHQMDANMYEYQAEAGILGAIVVLDPREPAPDNMVTYLLMAAYEPWTEATSGTAVPIEEAPRSGTKTAAATAVPAGGTSVATTRSSSSAGEAPPSPPGTACASAADIVVTADEEEEAYDLPDVVGLRSGTHGGSDTASGGTAGSTMGSHNHTMVVQSVSGEGWLNTETHESAMSQAPLGGSLRVNVVSFGSEFHTFHLHGYTWKDPGTGLTTDSVTVGPGTAYGFVVDELDNPGTWNVHCHVESHNHQMSAWLEVE
ncbi:MAG: multicopper oxidase domain-containing protein [Myxococcota bacterium]